MTTFIHWPQRAFAHLPPGAGCWLSVDELGTEASDEVLAACYADPQFRYILFIWPTQSRLLNEGNDWIVSMTNAVRWLHEYGIAEQCAGIQYGDEWWSALYTGSLTTSPYWRALHGMTPQQSWAARFTAAALWADRTLEFRRFWLAQIGFPCPPIGMAETAGCAPPEFAGQDWWGFNIYLMPGASGYLQTPAEVHALYDKVWAATRLPVQVVVPAFGERHVQVPPLAVLGQTYWEILHHRQVWSAGMFCLNHPAAYDPRHGPIGKGILQLGPEYVAGMQVLCEAMARRLPNLEYFRRWEQGWSQPTLVPIVQRELRPLASRGDAMTALRRRGVGRHVRRPSGLSISKAWRLSI